MYYIAKGKTVKVDGDNAFIELSEEELGRAMLNYIINNADSNIGEAFVSNICSGGKISVFDFLLNKSNDNSEVKKNKIVTTNIVEDKVENVAANSDVSIENQLDEYKEALNTRVSLLKELGSSEVKSSRLKDECPYIYKRITADSMSDRLISNCDIKFYFENDKVTYSIITFGSKQKEISLENNIVLYWNDAILAEVDELIKVS